MGWADCGTDSNGRPIGYAHQGICDHPGCEVKIDRGLDYACGGTHGTADGGCELYFCHEHLDPKRHQCSQGGVVAMSNNDLIAKAKSACAVIPLLVADKPGDRVLIRSLDEEALDQCEWTADEVSHERAWVEANAFVELRAIAEPLATALEQADRDLAAANETILRVRAEANEQRARADRAERELSDIYSYLKDELAAHDGCAPATVEAVLNERDEARAELARIKGAALGEELGRIAYRHAETERCGSTAMQSHEDRAALLDAVRVLTADQKEAEAERIQQHLKWTNERARFHAEAGRLTSERDAALAAVRALTVGCEQMQAENQRLATGLTRCEKDLGDAQDLATELVRRIDKVPAIDDEGHGIVSMDDVMKILRTGRGQPK